MAETVLGCSICGHPDVDHGNFGCRLTPDGSQRTLADPRMCPCDVGREDVKLSNWLQENLR